MTLQADRQKGAKETPLYHWKCKNGAWILEVISMFQIVAPVSTFPVRHLPPHLLEGQLRYTTTKLRREFVRVIKQTANRRAQTPDRAVMTWRRLERGRGKGKWKCSCQRHHFEMQITQKLRIQWKHFGLKIESTNQQSTWISFSVQHHLHCSAKTKKNKLPLDIPEFPFLLY